MSTERDPYSQAVDGLWAILSGCPAWSSRVLPRNQYTFTGPDRAPVKDNPTTADYPMAGLMPVSSDATKARTSSGPSDTVTFQLLIQSGDQRLDAVHFPLRWAAFCAFSAFDVTEKLKALVLWRGRSPIAAVRLLSAQDGMTTKQNLAPQLGGSFVGWSGLWNIEITFSFSKAELTYSA